MLQLIPNSTLQEINEQIHLSLMENDLAILPPLDIFDSVALLKLLGISPQVTIIDPWYNKGFGGVREDYNKYILSILDLIKNQSNHVFLWGFPEIIAYFVERIPEPLELVAWLTWYYKNNPSVIRGWRSSQNACLHLSLPKAKLYPEHFLTEKQMRLKEVGKLRYMPGPTSVLEEPLPEPTDVIEEALLVGFVGKKEQTGHPSQKPVAVYKKIILMTSIENDLIFDPMSGSGTTGEAARKHRRKSILCDLSEEYTQVMEKRLNVKRIIIPEINMVEL